ASISGILVGGPSPADGNLISGNTRSLNPGPQVQIDSTGSFTATLITIRNNDIHGGAFGASDVGVAFAGAHANQNTVSGNTIEHTGGAGITMVGVDTQNTLTRNNFQ